MRSTQVTASPPAGSARLVGVMGGDPLEPVDVPASVLAATGFGGEPGSVQTSAGPDGPIVLVGLGDVPDTDDLRLAAGAAARTLPGSTDIATSLHSLDVEGALEATVVGIQCGSYSFATYRSNGAPQFGELALVGEGDEEAIRRANTVAEGVWRARDWVNTPPVDKSPEVLAADMADRLRGVGYEVEVWGEPEIAVEGLGGLMAVAAGSDRPPRMLVARRQDKAGRTLSLVGKGIVFDSGGLSIKSAEGMETMKADMGGAAAVAAAAEAIAALGTDIGVRVYVPLTDNMPGGSATKPGDVLRARNGKTIEVLNTDAEGRLVLADALSLAAEEEPDLIVDMATLTGAARVALGDHVAAAFAPSDEARERLLAAAGIAGERVWPMPLPADYRKLIDSTVADMKNTGGRYGGAIAAALLLSEFVGEVPWCHVDIAGPAWFREDNALGPRGGSGYGVRTLISLAGLMSEG